MKKKRNGTPLISIGIIFKNEIRCIERCLKSLEPLRKLALCELVMADTGSTDGSREIAEKYADILIDFPWINDFSAARNAVMDRCSGKWYFSIDCDEWLDGDIKGMVEYLQKEKLFNYVAIHMRNYKSLNPSYRSLYTNFTAIRILRMSTGLRFVGAIHECWPAMEDGKAQQIMILSSGFLHHDGYAAGVWDDNKVKRNMELLKQKAKEEPDSLRVRAQLIESSDNRDEQLEYIRNAVQGIKDKLDGWENFGPSILRDAVGAALQWNIPELEEWAGMAEEWFPNSIYTKIDNSYFMAGAKWNQKDYDACIYYAEKYFKALKEYQSMRMDPTELLTNALGTSAEHFQQNLLIFLIGSYDYKHDRKNILQTLERIDATAMEPDHIDKLSRVLQKIYWSNDLDVSEFIRKIWRQICSPIPTEDQAEHRKTQFIRNASEVFNGKFIEREPADERFVRHAYGLYAALDGECALGTAAAIMTLDDKSAVEQRLSQIEEWDGLPICALERALIMGVRFPLPGKSLPIELMDRLAVRLAADGSELDAVMDQIDLQQLDSMQDLNWARAVLLAAVRVQVWDDSKTGMRLVRKFTQMEEQYIRRCYTAEMLTEEGIWSLPIMHRLGWYCIQAFASLDGGDPVGCARFLRLGLESCPEMKQMIKFIKENLSELKYEEPSNEMKELADKIRGILSAYAPDDPAVVRLKQSEAYQKVAYLIESIAVPVQGGLVQ